MKTKHWLCWHNWNKWGRPLQTYSGHKTQWRECSKCGLVRFRVLFWDKQTDTLAVHRSLDAVTGKGAIHDPEGQHYAGEKL